MGICFSKSKIKKTVKLGKYGPDFAAEHDNTPILTTERQPSKTDQTKKIKSNNNENCSSSNSSSDAQQGKAKAITSNEDEELAKQRAQIIATNPVLGDNVIVHEPGMDHPLEYRTVIWNGDKGAVARSWIECFEQTTLNNMTDEEKKKANLYLGFSQTKEGAKRRTDHERMINRLRGQKYKGIGLAIETESKTWATAVIVKCEAGCELPHGVRENSLEAILGYEIRRQLAIKHPWLKKWNKNNLGGNANLLDGVDPSLYGVVIVQDGERVVVKGDENVPDGRHIVLPSDPRRGEWAADDPRRVRGEWAADDPRRVVGADDGRHVVAADDPRRDKWAADDPRRVVSADDGRHVVAADDPRRDLGRERRSGRQGKRLPTNIEVFITCLTCSTTYQRELTAIHYQRYLEKKGSCVSLSRTHCVDGCKKKRTTNGDIRNSACNQINFRVTRVPVEEGMSKV